MQVNLLPSKNNSSDANHRLRQRVYSWTTLALVSYIVLVAAVAGWSLFLQTRQVQLSKEVVELSGQVQSLASAEALLRQQDQRVQDISHFLAARINYGTLWSYLVPTSGTVQIADWSYNLSGKQSLSVSASSAAELEQYAQQLVPHLPAVSWDAINQQSTAVWVGTLNLGGQL